MKEKFIPIQYCNSGDIVYYHYIHSKKNIDTYIPGKFIKYKTYGRCIIHIFNNKHPTTCEMNRVFKQITAGN